jgi:hypothetical protein
MPPKAIIPTNADSMGSEAASEAALAYDAWFRSEVEAGIREADDPNAVWVSNEEVNREMSLRRAEWSRRAKQKDSAR